MREEWCIGFLHAVSLDPQAWQPFFDAPKLARALRPIVLLGADEGELSAEEVERLSDPEWRDALSRAVIEAVLSLDGPRE